MLRLTALDPAPIEQIRYRNAARRGGTEPARVPVHTGRVAGLPGGLDALLLTSDLQGVVSLDRRAGGSALLGVAVAERLAAAGLADPARTGVILAGDLYSVPDATRRGGYGAVAEVWAAFAERFRWVVGALGNHDDPDGLDRLSGAHVLDGELIELDGLSFGGVGLVSGDPGRPGRREAEEQGLLMGLVAEQRPDLLVVHEGPPGGEGQPGSEVAARALGACPVPLVVCGHVHWESPLAEHPRGQVLNVDGRVVLLRAER